jgi:hypothetical protein
MEGVREDAACLDSGGTPKDSAVRAGGGSSFWCWAPARYNRLAELTALV